MRGLNSYDVLIETSGPASALDTFFREQLGSGRFSLNSVVEMPAALDLPMNNFVEDGYDALYGDWSKLAGRWMFKEAAAQRGYPFPLASREQVLVCIKALGEDGEMRLQLGRRFHLNRECHGHGHAAPWRKQHWGVELDVDEVVAEAVPDAVRLAFRSGSAVPGKALVQLSKRYADLDIVVAYVNEAGKRGRKFTLKKGRETEKYACSDEVIHDAIIQFRRVAGLQWLAQGDRHPIWAAQVEMNARGRPVFKGTGIAIDFALARLAAGETGEQLRQRFGALTADHIQALDWLAARRA